MRIRLVDRSDPSDHRGRVCHLTRTEHSELRLAGTDHSPILRDRDTRYIAVPGPLYPPEYGTRRGG